MPREERIDELTVHAPHGKEKRGRSQGERKHESYGVKDKRYPKMLLKEREKELDR